MKLFLMASSALAFDADKLKYPISVKNIPDQGSAFRVKTGSRLSIPLATPGDDVETYIIFTNDFARAEEIHEMRQNCKRGDEEACEADLKIYGNIMYKAQGSKLTYANLGGGEAVPKSEASISEANLNIENSQLSAGGFWWSVYAHQEVGETEDDISERVFKWDTMSLIQMVDSCTPSAYWDEDIDLARFGWHNGQFNDYGFAPGNTFAACSFKSSPPSFVHWESDDIDTKVTAESVSAIVPNHVIRAESLTCRVAPFEKLNVKFDLDECAENDDATAVLTPPSMLDYAYSDTSTSEVFKYYQKGVSLDAPTYRCPLVDNAQYVYAVTDGFQSENLLEHGLEAVPMEDHEGHDHEDGLAFGGIDEDHFGKHFLISIRAEQAHLGMHEFRCAYYTDEGLLGYSRPYVLTVYEQAKASAEVPTAKWGEVVDAAKRIVKEGQPLTNIANCWQSAGAPSMLQFGFRNQKGQNMLYKYPEHPIEQHAISLNMVPIGSQNQADIYCESFVKQADGQVVSKSVDLGTIEVIQKPYAMVVDAVKRNEMWTVTCHATVSTHDSVDVALSLDRKFTKPLGEHGQVTFNITGEYDERDLKRFEEKGTNCIFTSTQFPDEQFKSRVWLITKYEVIERGFMWGFLLMFGALAVIGGMCFGFNSSEQYEPVKTSV